MDKFWYRQYFKLAPDGDGGGTGGTGSGGTGGTGGNAAGGVGGSGDITKQLAEMAASNKALLDRIAKLEAPGNSGGGNAGSGEDLAAKAAKERLEAEQKKANETRLETAMKFTIGATDWLKTNAAHLPKTVEGIFTAAEKEKYASAVDKEAAVKVGIISEFFSLQANLDLLTDSQKVTLAEFSALTKDKKQEQAQQFYNSVFEPTFETLKKVKRAELLGKGQAPQSDVASAYKQRLMESSNKHFLGKGK